MRDALLTIWDRFRGLPVWAQAIVWLLVWPALAALWTLRRQDSDAGAILAIVVLLFGGMVWWRRILTSDQEPANVALEQATAEAETEVPAPTPTPTPIPTTTPTTTATTTPTPTPTPAPTAAPTPAQQQLPAGVPQGVQVGVVERIVDGDTIWVQATGPGPLQQDASHNIRLLQIDTPETHQGTECWGPEATAFAEERLLVGSTVYLQVDQETDQYGRFLRYVWTDEGDFFNAEAVVNGHAEAALYEPNDRHIDLMREAEQKARDAERGMWGEPCDYHDTLAPPPAPEPEPQPEDVAPQQQPDPEPAGDCEPGYDPCVPTYPPDVNCADVNGPIRVTGSDPHGLDGDSDGVECE